MRKNALTAVAGCRIFDIQFVLDRVTAFNRCRWSCATSAPTGTTPIGSWSSGSSPWSRNWTSWAAVSIRHLSCSLRSCSVATRRSGGVGARTCHGSEVTQSACKKCPFLKFFFAGDMVSDVEWDNYLQCFHQNPHQTANPLQPELLQTLNILNHLEDWHTY